MTEELLFTNAVKECRLQKKMSQADLAAAVGVSRNTVCSIETGQYSPTAKLAYALCLALDKRFEELFFFEGVTPPTPTLPELDLGGVTGRLIRLLRKRGWAAEDILTLIEELSEEG